jgi:hypothetical protein
VSEYDAKGGGRKRVKSIMMLSELPFYNLTDEEFYKETGVWMYSSVNSLLNESRDLFKDIIESPDKVNDCYENLAYDFLESKYLTIKQSGSKFSDIKHKGFSILHCNIRSLSKKSNFTN